MTHKFLTKQNLILAGLFLVFVFLRLFADSSFMLFGGDNLKYMQAAKNFPYHTLYNNQLYLLHPPFYPYVIHFFTLIFQEDYIAAIFISLISSIVTFFVLYKFFMMLTKNFSLTFFVLVFFTLSVSFIDAGKAVLKESFVVMLIFLSLHYYVKGVKFEQKKSLLLASVFGSFLAITTDHAVFIFPAFILSYLIFNNKEISIKKLIFPNLKYAVLPLIFTLLFYGSWLAVKYNQYSSSPYYPNGLEGTPVSTHDLGFMHLISPTFFDDFTEPYLAPGIATVVKKFAFQLGYMFDMEPFDIPLGLNFSNVSFRLDTKHIFYMIFLYLPIALIAAFGFFSIIKNFIKSKQIRNNANLYFIGLFFIFLFPITQSMVSPRFIYISYIFMFYFSSYGLFLLFMRKNMQQINSKLLVLVIVLLLLIPFWHYNNSHFIFSAEKMVASKKTADFINTNLNKEDGIMTQQGYSVRMIYLTGHRIIGLYPKPEKLMEIINYFDIKYVLFGKHFTSDSYFYSTDSVEFIKNSPEKFELIATIDEDYSNLHIYDEEDPKNKDVVYIYKVIRD